MLRILLLTNAAAGSSDAEAVEAAVQTMTSGADVEVRATEDEGALRRALEQRDGRRLVLAGGDGTLHLVLNQLYERGDLDRAEIALVPLGTGNDLARGVGIPIEPEASARLALDGRLKDMDVLVADDGTLVANAVHVGIGAEAARAAGPWKRALGPVGYVVGALLAGLTSQGSHLRIEADGQVLTDGGRRVLQVGVSNGPNIGGGTPLAPGADPGDGRADVTVSFAVGRRDRLLYGLHLKRGTHEERHDVRTVTATRVVVSGDPFSCNSDGELSGPSRQRSWTLRPAVYRLVVPA